MIVGPQQLGVLFLLPMFDEVISQVNTSQLTEPLFAFNVFFMYWILCNFGFNQKMQCTIIQNLT